MGKNSIRGIVFALALTAGITVLIGRSSVASFQDSVIWHDPGLVEELDFAGGPGGESESPEAPFTFIEELTAGKSAKVKVMDARGREWAVKWGNEVKAENIASRIAWAAGYFVLPSYFVKTGSIGGVGKLDRAKKFVAPDGSFSDARFQLWEDRFLKGHNWTWEYNPFVGTRQLNGLKIVMMLTSNWDNKDARNVDRGANTAIVECQIDGRYEYRYMVPDWGATMGKSGMCGITRDKWNCEGYTKQTPDFIKGVRGDMVDFGYKGWHDLDDVSLEDIRWLFQYLGRISDEQLRAGLEASGATPEEVECYTMAIRARLDQMKQLLQESTVTDTLFPRVSAFVRFLLDIPW